MVIKNEPLGDQVARELRRDILTGTRAAGELLIEKALSEEYGLSRGPVRDALNQINQEGFIEQNGRSYRVRAVMAEDIVEFVEIRLALETLAVERALKRNPDWSHSRAAVKQMFAAVERDDLQAFAEADLAFHNGLLEATPQRRLLETYRSLQRTLAILLEMNPDLDRNGLLSTAVEHEQLLGAIEAGDPRWPELLRQSLNEGYEGLLSRFGGHWGREGSSGE
ncbi:GntR family transcriptional regulator [Leucobacter sp. GX24907]